VGSKTYRLLAISIQEQCRDHWQSVTYTWHARTKSWYRSSLDPDEMATAPSLPPLGYGPTKNMQIL
jgi:hypothetical protein